MYQQTVPIDASDSLTISWEKGWRFIEVRYKGNLIINFPDKEDICYGRKFTLPDKGEFLIIMEKREMEIWYQGKELIRGIVSGMSDDYGKAVSALKYVAILQLVLAIPFYFLKMAGLELVLTLLFIAGLLFALHFWAQKTGDKVPLWIGLVFFGLNIAVTLISGSLAGVLISGVMIYMLYKGIHAEQIQEVPVRTLQDDGPLDSGI
ncbi:MAG: hypothetical protein IPL65_09875 [Lewinellaceae bacterium]|nr:hypothetical protein [Lewinellaceae bacterium]